MRYMIISYYLKPNGKHEEITEFKLHYRTKHLQSAKVILDLHEKKVIKNSFNPNADYDTILELYKRLLGDRLTPYLPKDQVSP